jgi:hypothetical protein
VAVDGAEDLARQFLRLGQVAKLEQCRRVRRRLVAQVDADESANGLDVLDRIPDAFVRQTEALLGYRHAQHACQADWRTARARDLRIERLDEFVEFALRRHAVGLGEEAVAPRELFLGGVFEVREGLLHGRCRAMNVA